MNWQIVILLLFAGQALAQDPSIENEVEESAAQVENSDTALVAPETEQAVAPISSEPTASELWNSAKDKKFQIEDALEIEEIVEPQGEYHYAAFSRPNPFLAPDLNLTINPMEIGGTEIPMLNALQNYPLKDLSVKGIWALPNGKKRAIVMTPRREGVIVEVDDPISAGKVKEITADYIVARQFRVLADGTRQFDDKKLYLGEAPTDHKGVIKFLPGADPIFDRGGAVDTPAGAQPAASASPATTAVQSVATPPMTNSPAASAVPAPTIENNPSTQSN